MYKYTLSCKGPRPLEICGLSLPNDLFMASADAPVLMLDESQELVKALRSLLAEGLPLAAISIVQRHALGRVPLEHGQFNLVDSPPAGLQVQPAKSLFSVTNTRTGRVACYFSLTPQKKNGCHNRAAFNPTLPMQEGWQTSTSAGVMTRVAVMRDEPFRMRLDCSYTHTVQGRGDKGCVACQWRALDAENPSAG